MNKKILSLVLAIAGLMLVPGAQASFLIDDFSVFDFVFEGDPPSTSALGTSSEFAAARDLTLTSDTGSPVLATSGGELGVSAGGAGTNVIATIAYSDPLVAGTNFNFTESSAQPFVNAFVIDYIGGDILSTIYMTLFVDGISSGEVEFLSLTAGPLEFGYDLFDIADLDSVDAISLVNRSGVALDMTFENFRAYGAAPAVPEPTAFILLASAFAACRVRQHTKRTKYIST